MAKRFLFPKWPRGTYGDWRGRIYLPMFARAGFFDGKVIAPNYLYYAVLNRHSPDDIQIRGNRTTAPSPRELCSIAAIR